MATFWDLPRPVRDKIYRLHLVSDKPLSNQVHLIKLQKRDIGYYDKGVPPVMRLSRQAEREAGPIYYGENRFEFNHCSEIDHFFATTWPRHRKFISSITFTWGKDGDYSYYGRIGDLFKKIAAMRGLMEFNIRVDEEAMVARIAPNREIRQRKRSENLTPQQQLAIFRFPSVAGLLNITNVPNVRFLKMVRKVNGKEEEYGGMLPDGPLLTYILPRLRPPPKHNKKWSKKSSGFRLLDLPPELRNRIYDLLLRVDGPIHPSKEPPTTGPRDGHRVRSNETANHESALALLLVNKQVHEETFGIFYNRNAFVFYYPTQLHAFLQAIGPIRQKQIRDLTIHYHNTKLGGIELIDLTFEMLKQLTGLRRLHIIMVSKLHEIGLRRGWYSQAWGRSSSVVLIGCNPALIPGMKILFDLRGIDDIKLRDTEFEEIIDKLKAKPEFPNFPIYSNDGQLYRLSKAYEHFNKALALAQRGKNYYELLKDKYWQTRDEFPVLADDHEDNSEDDGEDDESCRESDSEGDDDQDYIPGRGCGRSPEL